MALDAATWTAIAFLMAGIVLVLAEIFQPGFFIAIPGGTFFLGGALALGFPGLMFGVAGWILWPLVFIVATVVNVWVYKRWAPPDRKPFTLSIDSLPGEVGEVTVPVAADSMRGKVRIRGGTWSARSNGASIPVGGKVRVVRAEGVHIVVEPVDEAAPLVGGPAAG